VDASEWDLHVKVACGAGPVFTGAVYGGVVAAMATQNDGISFYTHTHAPLLSLVTLR
jgi:hypothetical protein